MYVVKNTHEEKIRYIFNYYMCRIYDIIIQSLSHFHLSSFALSWFTKFLFFSINSQFSLNMHQTEKKGEKKISLWRGREIFMSGNFYCSFYAPDIL